MYRSNRRFAISTGVLTAVILVVFVSQIGPVGVPWNAVFPTRSSASGLREGVGLDDDGLAHLPVNYTGFVPPVAGSNYLDGSYGTTITRLSNGIAQFND